MSFSTGGLLLYESVKIAILCLDIGSFKEVRKRVVNENLLQTRTQKSCIRLCQEVLTRLKTLDKSELEFLVNSEYQEQAHILWIAICRRYKFIGDFAIYVLREHYLSMKSDLPIEEFDTFFNQKMEWHPELCGISAHTRYRLRQNLFLILKQLGFLSDNYQIISPLLSEKLIELISIGKPSDIIFFPANEISQKKFR